MIKNNKNKKTLLNFEEYCTLHPKERFWQCLRNWNQLKNPEQNFILTAKINNENNKEKIFWKNIKDTFYNE